MDETSLMRDALKQQSLEKGNNWLNKIKQELEGLGMGDIWINGEENNRNVWREVSKRCMDTEGQNMKASMKEKRSLVFYNELKNNWEKKLYIEVCTQEARRGIRWWKMGIWRLNGVRGNIEQGMCPMCNKEEGWSHTLRYDETKSWREDLADKRFTSIEPEIGIRRVAARKYNDKLQTFGLYLNVYKEKWKRAVMKYDEEQIID
jgi:hypothetical protein